MMSGTSMDGIDLAIIRTDGETVVERGQSSFHSYGATTKKLLESALIDARAVTKRGERPGVLEEAELAITELHCTAIENFFRESKLDASNVDLLGFHGQTVLHRPENALTVQLGLGDVLARRTGIRTVSDMRANDMVHGGQGAPLVPIYHQALSSSLPTEFMRVRPVVFVNIGGISNITYIGEDLVAFDTGPGNALIDQWVQQQVGIDYDQGGMIAAEGDVKEAVVENYLSNDFFQKDWPKSLDRNDFQLPTSFGLSVEDGARTLARVTAAAIMKSTEHLPAMPALWIICGGGRKNPHILRDLKTLASEKGSRAVTAEDCGFDGDAMEAEAWAYLAVRASAGLPLTFPGTTGCRTAVSGGVIHNP